MKINSKEFRELLKTKNITQDKLANLVAYKSPEGFMLSIDRGTIPLLKYIKVCNILEIPFNHLLLPESEKKLDNLSIFSEKSEKYIANPSDNNNNFNETQTNYQFNLMSNQLKSLQTEIETMRQFMKFQNQFIDLLKDKYNIDQDEKNAFRKNKLNEYNHKNIIPKK